MDIVERLKAVPSGMVKAMYLPIPVPHELAWEAADEIERLRAYVADYKKLWETSNALDQQISEDWSAECKRLREALRKIARIDYRGPMPDGVQIAREALGEKE